ncbi:amidohydrolase [Arthrobacter sp. H14]|uniref:amidohydrolase n=1 Tax=Arthrobacter sp. H14 TaxID=1312959 RepID=UPI0004789F96|nr:amidohydrolase [Arthrobacter sp. H14]
MTADWVFHSGRVFDGWRLHPSATAVAVRAGRIIAVGTDDEVRAAAGTAAEAVNLHGRLLSPGFTDAHVHTVTAGIERLGCDLSQTSGASALVAKVSEYAAGTHKAWIAGGGWYMHDFPGGTPTKELLDAVAPDRPVYLINRDHHGAWVNSVALRMAGIDAGTPDPADGRVERDEKGNPTGTLHEGAMDLVNRLIPALTQSEMDQGLLEGQQYLHGLGVTGWQEAILGDYAGYGDASASYRRLLESGQLTGRATGSMWVPRTTTTENIAELVEEFGERRRINAAAGFPTVSAKIMVDGVPENQTAAMLEPYLRPCSCAGIAGGPEPDRGLTYLPKDVLLQASAALDAAGFDLHMHVIGDRAVRDGLDAVEHARRHNGHGGSRSDRRHHMAHIQIVHPTDIPRFAALEVTANAQALWACNDQQMTELTVPVLGRERSGWQYPFRSLVSSGAALAMGSDWPVSTPDPWQAIHVAVSRREPDAPSVEPLVPAESLSLQTALAAYTSGSAWLNRQEEAGRIEPGLLADIAVMNTDPFELDPADLHIVGADLTMVGGQVVHDRLGQRITV